MSTLAIVTILFLSAFISGIAVFFIKRDDTNFLKLVLSFSGAYLFTITVLHLIPHVYHSGSGETIGLWVLGGFLFQIVLEQFSHGIEHGHVHKENQAGIFPMGIMISLCLHAFIEGMPLATNHQNELVFGIAIHHIPAAFALATLLLSANLRKSSIYILLFLFAAMTPAGFLLSKAISSGNLGNIEQHFDKLMAIVIGIFLHISTTILFESGSHNHHHFNRKKMIAVLIGVAIGIGSLMIGGHDHSEDGHNHSHQHHHEGHDHQHDEHDHQHDEHN
jgi:zinc and cadmium transporter